VAKIEQVEPLMELTDEAVTPPPRVKKKKLTWNMQAEK
jgi:hypothetical protein